MSGKLSMEPGQFGNMLKRLRDRANSPLVRNTFYYGLNFGLQILTQFGYFVLISRALGIGGYGIFASVSAVALTVSVFVGWGSDHLLIQRVAIYKDQFAAYFGRALTLVFATMIPAVLFAMTVLYFLNTGDLNLLALAGIVIAECGFRKITFLCSAAYMAHDRAGKQFVIDNGSMLLRLVAIATLTLVAQDVTLNTWAAWYVCASAFTSTVSVVMVVRDFGLPRLVFSGFEFKQGFLLGLEFASISGLKDLDKPVIVQTLGADQAGLYTAAFRIIDAATAPVRAVLFATYTRYFRHAHEGVEHGIAFGMRIIPFISALGLAVAVAVLIGAGYVPLIIGKEYEPSVDLIRTLALYPLFLGAAGIGADIMRSVGMQGIRVVLVLISNFVVIGIVWVGSTTGGLEGAVIARMVTQLLILTATWTLIGRKKKSHTGEGEDG
ncbi:lipopolysaccharide biosynthesis protein [uncultured Roseibium sp.]|uniref:lipopolysaccharide biosynthesis protein n=1 Tax=uncultured Roseibium sp. TaxID=1936171 RepID=UPI00321740B3